MELKRLFDVCSKLQRPKAAEKSKKAACEPGLCRVCSVGGQVLVNKNRWHLNIHKLV